MISIHTWIPKTGERVITLFRHGKWYSFASDLEVREATSLHRAGQNHLYLASMLKCKHHPDKKSPPNKRTHANA